MKAIRVHQFGGPEVLRLEEISIPQPAPDQILVRVKAIGVNPVETYIRSGHYSKAAGVISTLPYTPGRDAAGVVEKIGAEICDVKIGDRVYVSNTSTGAYAEFCLCGADDVHPLPEKVSFSQGAGLSTPYATAWRALFQRAKALPGETVLIHGASGGVGTAATQIARAAGLVIFGTASTDAGKNLVLENGAHHVFDHHAPDYLQQAVALTNGRGFDVIIEMLANINLAKDLTALAKNGRVIVVGNRGTIEINPRDLMSRDAQVLGMTLFNASAAELKSIFAALGAGLENGGLRPVVGKEMPLTDAAKAHEAVLASGAFGKIVLVP
jgi:NADPH:quinone reductase